LKQTETVRFSAGRVFNFHHLSDVSRRFAMTDMEFDFRFMLFPTWADWIDSTQISKAIKEE
jgi:hypothetical protein